MIYGLYSLFLVLFLSFSNRKVIRRNPEQMADHQQHQATKRRADQDKSTKGGQMEHQHRPITTKTTPQQTDHIKQPYNAPQTFK